MKQWLFVLSLAYAYCVCATQDKSPSQEALFQVTRHLEGSSFIEGEPFLLELRALYPSAYFMDKEALVAALSASLDPLSSAWLLSEVTSQKESLEKGQESERVGLTLIPTQSGRQTLFFRPLFFALKAEEEDPRRIPYFLEPLTVEIAAAPLTETLTLAPLLPLTEEFPLALSLENERLFVQNKEREGLNEAAIALQLQKKMAPWWIFIALLGGGVLFWVLFFFFKAFPVKKARQEVKPSFQEYLAVIIERLESFTISEEGRKEAYEAIEQALRVLFSERWGGDRKCFTNAELAKELSSSQGWETFGKPELLFLLSEIDKVKFAAFQPSQEDWDQLISILKKINYLGSYDNPKHK